MNGIVSLLDADHEVMVRALWSELERDFDVKRVREEVPFPHITFQGAGRYALKRMDTILQRLARDTAPFTVRTAGLGIFSGPHPVLTIAVIRDRALDAFYRRVWEAVGDAASDLAPYYYASGDRWMPHITLAQGDLTADNLPAIASGLSQRPFEWDIRLDNLAFFNESKQVAGYELRRFAFGSGQASRLP